MKIPPSPPPSPPHYFKVSRPSHIACTVTGVYVTCKETALHVYKNSCKVLIRLSKTNLNLPICSSFFLSCVRLPTLLLHPVVILAPSLRWFFVCLYGSRICCPAIKHTSLCQSKHLFPFILLCSQENIIEQVHWVYV